MNCAERPLSGALDVRVVAGSDVRSMDGWTMDAMSKVMNVSTPLENVLEDAGSEMESR